MGSRFIIFSGFILMVIAQIAIPAKMILDRENVLNTGTEYRFRTAPIDPNDPYRGKYVNLSYKENSFTSSDTTKWEYGEMVYVTLTTDTTGFARMQSISKTAPSDTKEYVSATIDYANGKEIGIDFPFDRFYMEETKAPLAEESYRESQRDTTQVAWAVVVVHEGDAVLKDVMIDGVSLKDLVHESKEQTEDSISVEGP